MPKKLSLKFIQRAANRFCKLRNIQDLAELLNVETYHLKLTAASPQYNIFSIPKKNGTKRWIEDPEDRLQNIQDKVAFYLGAVYYLKKTDAAYGFIISVKNEKDPRHIITNAQQHLGKNYLFNADFKDFFHQVKAARLEELFAKSPFSFSDELVTLLVNICTNQGRLPMGAPTSPVLSNLATIRTDEKLLTLAQWAGWVYTRYADDLSFSSIEKLKETEIQQILDIAEGEGFEFNKFKFKSFGPEDEKLITGVKLGKEKVELPDGFLDELEIEISKLNHVIEVAHRMGKREKWIEKFRQQVTGKVNFVQQVLGDDDDIAFKITENLESAIEPTEEHGAQSWLNFAYFGNF